MEEINCTSSERLGAKSLQTLTEGISGPYLFGTERGATAATVRKMVARAGERAKIGFAVHPHMLRHSTGYKLANDGQDTRATQQGDGVSQTRPASGGRGVKISHAPEKRFGESA